MPRFDTWLTTYAAAQPPQQPTEEQTPTSERKRERKEEEQREKQRRAEYESYLVAVGAKTLIAGVARIMEPGCKSDCMTILEGNQGWLKSTVWRTLASDAWFLDDLGRHPVSKYVKESLLGKWVVEFPELSAFSRVEIEQIKQFLAKKRMTFVCPMRAAPRCIHAPSCLWARPTCLIGPRMPPGTEDFGR